jgi:hypothetical protein
MEQEYKIYFIETGTEVEELIFTTNSLTRAQTGADINYAEKKDQGQVIVKLLDEVVHTCV